MDLEIFLCPKNDLGFREKSVGLPTVSHAFFSSEAATVETILLTSVPFGEPIKHSFLITFISQGGLRGLPTYAIRSFSSRYSNVVSLDIFWFLDVTVFLTCSDRLAVVTKISLVAYFFSLCSLYNCCCFEKFEPWLAPSNSSFLGIS